MKIEHKNKVLRLNEIAVGRCFVYGDILYIKTKETRDGLCGNRETSCVDLENGYVCWLDDDDVVPVNAKVVVEDEQVHKRNSGKGLCMGFT